MKETSDELASKLKNADECMFQEKPEDALPLYQHALKLSTSEDEESKVWILLSIANAAIRCGEMKESKDALGQAYAFVHTGIVVGNPLFHLLVGLTYEQLKENPSAKDENFARAIICGGAKIFKGEDEKHINRIKKVLDPPEMGTWDDYEGCSLDTLNGAKGHLAKLIEDRMGKQLPFEVFEYSDDSEDEEDCEEEEGDDHSVETGTKENVVAREAPSLAWPESKRQRQD